VSASRSALIASAAQCSLSGGTPSRASIKSFVVNSLHSAIERPKIRSDNIDPHAVVGPRPTVWYLAAEIRPLSIFNFIK
jgi:hypothetical protein